MKRQSKALNRDFIPLIKKCVTFLFVKDPNGEGYLPIGTGFFVAIRIGKGFDTYLVTAKHVLEPEGKRYPDVYARMNKRNGMSELVQFIFGPKLRIITHPDPNLDIALFRCALSITTYDYTTITRDFFSTKDLSGIVEGDDVFYSGLFGHFIGKERNQPVVRFGKVSLLTEEKIPINKQAEPEKLANLYMFECQADAGSSGSPVFFAHHELRQDKRGAAYEHATVLLAGVMKGHYDDLHIHEPNDYLSIVERQNAGIALVTPCYQLEEILFSDELVKERERFAKEQGFL